MTKINSWKQHFEPGSDNCVLRYDKYQCLSKLIKMQTMILIHILVIKQNSDVMYDTVQPVKISR